MKLISTIAYSFTVTFFIATVLTFVWALIDVFIGNCNNISGYSFLTCVIAFMVSFIVSMVLTTKESNRYEDSNKQ